MKIIYLFVCLFVVQSLRAQNESMVYPCPQVMNVTGNKFVIPDTYSLIGEEVANPNALAELKELFGEQQKAGKFAVYIGKKGDKAIRKYARMIPEQAEGYYLLIEKDKVVVAGHDERGTFYAVQTLSQLMQDGQLPEVEIKDYPAIRFRGVVEGFYGTPWSHHARLRQLEFYGKNKMNTYIYGPKDDPYHSCPNWRKPYPAEEAQQISELVKTAKRNEVDFVWAIHPGQDIKWNEEDRTLLLGKFEMMYQLGVRAFAVFFDDISGEGTNPTRQAELLNYIDDHFVKIKGDVKPLIMCPTEYNKSWSNPAKGYLATLGTKLNPSVQIMWTGDRVVSDITEEGLKWVNEKIKRPAYIWWNFPVSDYVRDHLLMGAVYGLDTHVAKEMSGFVTNPMEYAEASKIAIFSVADYAWNLEKFNSNASWKSAVRAVMPSNSDALQLFVDHNSDLGANGHGYRREESVDILPAVNRFLEQYRQGSYKQEDFESLYREFTEMIEAADLLLTDDEEADLVKEITPWLNQFRLLGEAGCGVLEMAKAAEKGDKELFIRKHKHLKALQKRSFGVDRTYNQNPYQPGIKSGSKVIQPFIDTLFCMTTRNFNRQTGNTLDSKVFTSPHKMNSTVGQLKTLPVRVKTNRIIVSPLLEVVKWGAGEYLGLEMDKEYMLQGLEADFGVPSVIEWLQPEVSTDGTNWTKINVNQDKNQIKGNPKAKARFIRMTNKSDKLQEVYLRKFIITTVE